jgi:hypothetical protein
MTFRPLVLAAALAVALAPPLSAAAQTANAPRPHEAGEQKITLDTATALMAYGRAKSDPFALIAGVRMMASVPGAVVGPDGARMDLFAVLDEAVSLADGNASLIASPEDMSASLRTASA